MLEGQTELWGVGLGLSSDIYPLNVTNNFILNKQHTRVHILGFDFQAIANDHW